jgi:hypothetical protein
MVECGGNGGHKSTCTSKCFALEATEPFTVEHWKDIEQELTMFTAKLTLLTTELS